MSYTLERITEPAFVPVSIAEAKDYLRVWHQSDDTQIALLLAAAVNRAQDRTGRQLVNVQFKLTMPCFPSDRYMPLPIASLVSVESVTYLDADAVRTIVSTADYRVTTGLAGSVFRTSASWPTTTAMPGNVEVTYTAGHQPSFTAHASNYSDLGVSTEGKYGCLTEDDLSRPAGVYQYTSGEWVYVRPLIPEELKVGILQSLWHLYDSRGEVSGGTVARIPNSAESIFESFNIGDEFETYGVLVDQYTLSTVTATSGGAAVAVDSYDTVDEVDDRPAFGLNVDGDSVEDGYRVKVLSNGLTYLLTANKSDWDIADLRTTVNTSAELGALYETDERQKVHVRELAEAGSVADFRRNTANTSWMQDTT